MSYHAPGRGATENRDVRDILIASGPKAFLSLASAICSVLIIALVSVTGCVIGTYTLSIHGTVNDFVLILTDGIAGAVGVMTGIACGEKNGDDLTAYGVIAHRYMFILSVCAIAILAACASPLTNALTDSPESAELLRFSFFSLMITIPFSLLVNARISYMQAIGKLKEAHWLGIGANLVVFAAAACLLTALFGVRGVFVAYPASQIAVLVIIWGLHCRRKDAFNLSDADYLEVDDSYFVLPCDVIDYPIRSREDCALASEQVVLFCRGHRITERQGFLAGLCVEELLINVVEHGFSRRQVCVTADIRVVLDRGDVIIRARDSGPAFNLKRFAGRMEAGGSETGNGIRILVNASKNVSYYRTYGMNTTIIKI